MATSSHAQKSAADLSDTSLWKELSSCPLCGHGTFHTIFQASDRHYGNLGPFPIVECHNCGLHFLSPMPTLAYLSNAYPVNYYSYAPAAPESGRSRMIKRIKKMARYILCYHSGWTGDPKFKTPGAMLDFGCGSGAFLMAMRENGWKVYGAELDTQAAERGRRAGLDIFGGTIEAANFPPAEFDYVRSNHSFEHIHNPREVLREMRRIVKPTGLLFIGVPNVAGLMARLFGAYWWYRGAPVHTFGYSPVTLERLLAEEGFKVERVHYNSTFAGIFGSLQLWLNRNNGKLGDAGWIVSNPILRLIGYWVARVLDFLRMGDCIEIIARPV